METSGLVLVAKNAAAHRSLSMACEGRDVKKKYLAVVRGRPPWPVADSPEEGFLCDLPLVPDGNKRHQTIVDRYRGKKSITRFKLLISAGNYSVVEAYPETGRTHQIRVHLASLGYPIVCDSLYGPTAGRRGQSERGVYLSEFKRGWRGDKLDERPLLDRLGLHALQAVIPAESEALILEAPPPRDFSALLNQMKKCQPKTIEG
jgi:23S rRNA-/tRNA-specific pseudouridylate synthase